MNILNPEYAVSGRIKVSIWVILSSLSFLAQASSPQDGMTGMTLHNTRVIYPSTATNGVTYQLTNNSSQAYLLQARIQPWVPSPNKTVLEHQSVLDTQAQPASDDNSRTLIVLPPLQRIEPGETATLLLRLKHNNLHTQDRESIAVLALTAIPAEKSAQISTTPQMVIAVQNNVKLFYRPAALPRYDEGAINNQLQFVTTKTGMTVKNPGAFYVTFDRLSVGSHAVDLGHTRMVAPYSEQQWPLTLNDAPKHIEWQVINDQGGVSDEVYQKQLPDS